MSDHRLAAIEDIRVLKALYAERVDANHRAPSHTTAVEATALFTDDAVLDLGPFGRYVGHAQILNAFENIFPAATAWSAHHILNPIITLTGASTATGRWYFLLATQPKTTPASPAITVYGSYAEKYEKTAEGWKFKEVIGTLTAPAP